jgi:DNA-directed RNA polymerase subunit omega
MTTPKNLILPDPNVLNKVEYGKFVLANLAAKRAKQIKEGAPPLVRIESNHPLSIALAEIAAGKIKPVLDPDAVPAMDESLDIPTLDLSDEDFLLPGLGDEEEIDVEVDGLTLDDLEDLEEHDEEEELEVVKDEEDEDEEVLEDLISDDVVAEDDNTMSLEDLQEQEGDGDEENQE